MGDGFFSVWHQSATTTLGLFWMAFWAFGLGYVISSMIQVFVTRERMRRTMGETGPRSVLLGSVFGFVSSSCSFAALSTTRALFAKGAGLVPSLAFLLASTNLVVELGIVIAVFLGWQFVVGEYVGGILLILFMWLTVRLTRPKRLINQARERARAAEGDGDEEVPPGRIGEQIRSLAAWRQVSRRYLMEWGMVWKEVAVGFTAAGIIAAFVPPAFFQALFVGSEGEAPGFPAVLAQAVIGPIAAFFTFIGSMGNIPLAAVLYTSGVSFAGVMAFIFSDLVVLPVLRIQARYYGWRMALYVAGVFLLVLVAASVIMHYAFALFGLLPDATGTTRVTERTFFAIDYTFFLDLLFIAVTVGCLWWKGRADGFSFSLPKDTGERILFGVAMLAFLWLALGLLVGLFL